VNKWIWFSSGNFFAAWNLMEECLVLAKAQYGSDGIEVAGVISTMMSIAQAIAANHVTQDVIRRVELHKFVCSCFMEFSFQVVRKGDSAQRVCFANFGPVPGRLERPIQEFG
jgi:hypothetical protein